MWLTRLALRNPVLILMVSLMTVAIGWVSLTRLSVDLFPTINLPNIRIATFYTGAGPADIEKTITLPIERAVSAAPGVDRVESTSKQGVSVVTVWFNFGTVMTDAQFEVQQRIAQILNTLPPGVGQPLILKFDIANIPVVQIAATSDELGERELYDLAYNTIEPQLERLPGVANATVGGGKVRELQVLADRDALRARGLSLLDVVNAVKNTNVLLPSGTLRTKERDYNVYTNSQVKAAEELEDVVLASGGPNGGPVRVRDVAQVLDGSADQDEIVRVNGQRGVYFRVLKQPDANTIAVVDAVKEAMGHLRGVPPNVHLAISFDQSNYIRKAVKALEDEAVQGGLLAIAIILIFLVSFRATGIVAVAIPLSVIATFVLLFFTGQTLNVFTLGGLALAVGRLVDDSIVELENIHRHYALTTDKKKAVLDAAQEVALPILVSTITTIVVFFPVLFLTGIPRNLFIPLALTISFALIVSFFVSRTVTPLLCLYWLKPHNPAEQKGLGGWLTRTFDRLDDAYARTLERVLKHRGLLVLGVLALFFSSALLFPRIGKEFFPDSDESQFQVSFKAPIGTRLTQTEDLSDRLEKTVVKTLGLRPDPKGMVTTLLTNDGLPQGRTALFSGNTGPHSGTVSVNLVNALQRPVSDVKASEMVRKAFGDNFPGVQLYFFIGGIVKRILNFGSQAPIDVEVLGYDLEEGAVYARQVQARLKALVAADNQNWLTDVQVSREENYPEIDVDVDRAKAGVLGLNQTQISQSVLSSLVGNTQFAPIPFTDPKSGNEYYINVRAPDRQRTLLDDISEVQLRSPQGMVSLSSVADVTRGSGPVTITRRYLQRVIDVTANIAPGKDLGGAAAAVRQALEELPPPDGFTVKMSGTAAAQQDAFAGLGLAAVMALALVYMVLASQFKSLLDPLVIMFSVPMGFSGVLVMLWATGTSLSVNSFMGVIMMIGIVVSNGVLLVDFANVLRRRGLGLVEATVRAARTRLRPILMTTLATLIGLAPMAFGLAEGSETNLPLARAVIGGLAVSTFFTLFLIPSIYTALERFSKRDPTQEEEAA